MITYLKFEEKYSIQVYNLVYNIMTEELKIDKKVVVEITKDLKNIKSNYLKNDGNFWIAIDNQTGEVIGTVAILKINNEEAEFKRFYVRKDYRNKHIGFKLYSIAEEYANYSGIKTLYLVTGKESKKAHWIYYKNGWNRTNKEYDNVGIFIREGANLYKKHLIQKEC